MVDAAPPGPLLYEDALSLVRAKCTAAGSDGEDGDIGDTGDIRDLVLFI